MRFSRRIFAVMLALVLSMCMVITAYAATNTASAGIYGTIRGTIYQNRSSLASTTQITTNPDRAYLQIKFELKNSGSTISIHTRNSDDRATNFPYNWAISYPQGNAPNLVYSTHGVQGGSSAERGYATYIYLDLDTSYFN